jgi:EmrB/QacA subfamily drug resistance transporter
MKDVAVARAHPTRTVAPLALATLAFSLQQTMILPALPAFQQRYGVSPTASAWLLTAFLLSAAITTPILGRLGDMYGKARILLVALGIFAAGSALAAVAGSFPMVLAGRTVQGTGAAVMPLAFGIIRDEIPRERAAVAIGLLSSMLGIGGGAALVLAGILVEHAGLSWLFWSGFLVTAAAAVGTWAFVPESPVRSPARIDVAGAALLSVSLVTLLLAISEGNHWGWGSPAIVGLLAASVATGAAWLRYEQRTPDPLVDIELMRRREVWTPNLVAAAVGAAMFGAFVLIPQLAQTPVSTGYGFGDSVAAAGLVLLPSALTMLFAGPLAGALGNRFGARLPLRIGCVAAAASYFWFAAFHGAEWQLYVGSAMLGLGLGLSLSSMGNLVVHSVPQAQTGIATAINMIARSIGGAIGAQLAAAILTSSTVARGFPAETGYSTAFAVSGAAAVIAWLAAVVVPRELRAAITFAGR